MSKSASDQLDEIEHRQMNELGDRLVARSVFCNLAINAERTITHGQNSGKICLMGEDPRLPKMPEKPTLLDFFRYRFATGPAQHLLQSANLARKNGLSEKMVLACLLHDISVVGFIRADHGYWGAQMIEPYVDEEVCWAIRMHQSLRFFPDETVGYAYPENYVRLFGPNYKPDSYIYADYERAKNHKWYMSARMICVNDLYSFDPNVVVVPEDFEEIIGRHFKQPKEGLGNDNTSSSHMWRTLIRPANAL
jgi:hypothetical protein